MTVHMGCLDGRGILGYLGFLAASSKTASEQQRLVESKRHRLGAPVGDLDNIR